MRPRPRHPPRRPSPPAPPVTSRAARHPPRRPSHAARSICCPSRSETVTGRYLQNLKTPGQCKEGYSGKTDSGHHCCMHVDEGLVNPAMFGIALQRSGYAVGIFGKYLNTYDQPRAIPRGVDAFMGNGGGQYDSPFFNVDEGAKAVWPKMRLEAANGTWVAHQQYTTAVVGNVSLAWIRHAVAEAPHRPFFAYIAPKAAHEPFTPAPWYTDVWPSSWPAGAPRTPSYNLSMAQRADKVAHVAAMDLISPTTAACIDVTFKNRWRTLMSVDDVIGAVIAETKALGVFDNTYFMYSSDHGFQLGNQNLA